MTELGCFASMTLVVRPEVADDGVSEFLVATSATLT